MKNDDDKNFLSHFFFGGKRKGDVALFLGVPHGLCLLILLLNLLCFYCRVEKPGKQRLRRQSEGSTEPRMCSRGRLHGVAQPLWV